MTDKPIIAVGKGGMMNPDSHLPCGAKDNEAKFPEPAHVSCPRCERRIKKLLITRAPQNMLQPEVEQGKIKWE